MPGRGERPIKSGLDLSEFMALARNARLFYPSHEGSILDFQITLRFQDGTYRMFEARVPERHVTDLAVRFYVFSMGLTRFCLPDEAWIGTRSRRAACVWAIRELDLPSGHVIAARRFPATTHLRGAWQPIPVLVHA